MIEYQVECIYERSSSWLSVRDRSSWRTRRVAVNHARDVARVRSRAGMMLGLIAVRVWRIRDNTLPGPDYIVDTFEVQP